MPAGRRLHWVTLSNPGTPTSDGDGGWTQTPVVLAQVRAAIDPAAARNLESLAAGTIISQATHVVNVPYMAGVTTETVLTFGTREFHVLGVVNPEERNRELNLMCVETVL